MAALPTDTTRMNIVVRFSPDSPGASTLHGNAKAALTALRPSLCGTAGMLARYDLRQQEISIVAYEGEARVGTVSLPPGYCGDNAGL